MVMSPKGGVCGNRGSKRSNDIPKVVKLEVSLQTGIWIQGFLVPKLVLFPLDWASFWHFCQDPMKA